MNIILIWLGCFVFYMGLFSFVAFFGDSKTKKGITKWILVIIKVLIAVIIAVPITLGIIFLVEIFR